MVDIHNEMKYAAAITGATRIIGGVDGSVHPAVERISETLQPGFDIFAQPEHAILRGERLGAIRSFQGAVAAESSIIAFINPTNSRRIVVVESISVTSNTAGAVFLEVASDTTLAATLGAFAPVVAMRDQRFQPFQQTGVAGIRIGSDPSNTLGVQLDQEFASTTSMTLFDQVGPIVLRPGFGVYPIHQVVNASLVASFRWRERDALPGEIG